MSRGAKQQVKCKCCRQPFMARVADVKRGWGKFCSKSCKASWQERRTGQYAAFQERQRNNLFVEPEDPSWDAHKSTF